MSERFAQLYDAWHDRVLAYAAKLIGRDDADDVANEVFVKIARSLDTLDDESRLTSWIYAITANTVRDTIRARSRRIDTTGEEDLSAMANPAAPTPEETAIRSEMVVCYLDYVKKLPPRYYEAYVLSELEHLSNAEIAARLGVSVATAKITLHRARARLNEALRKHCRCYYNARGELMGEPK